MAERLVSAGEGVDAVVVGGMGEGADLVEEVVGVASADDRDQAVFRGGGGGAGADVLRPGCAYAAGVVAAQDVAFVAVDDGAAGGAGFLLDDDADALAVALGGGGDELLDGAGWDAHG